MSRLRTLPVTVEHGKLCEERGLALRQGEWTWMAVTSKNTTNECEVRNVEQSELGKSGGDDLAGEKYIGRWLYWRLWETFAKLKNHIREFTFVTCYSSPLPRNCEMAGCIP